MVRFSLVMLSLFMMISAASRTVSAAEPMIIRQATSDVDWYPLQYYSVERQTYEGLLSELVRELFVKELGWEVQVVARPWIRAQNEVEVGEADFFLAVATPVREDYALRSAIPLYRLYQHLYTFAGHPQLNAIKKIKTVDDIKALDLLLVSNLGNGWHKSQMEDKGVKTEWVRADEQMLRFLALQRADAMIDVAPTMNYRIGQMGLAGQLVQTDVTFGPTDFYIMVGKKSPFAARMAEINAALHRMQERGVLQQ